jgi:salicylate hydroxylase
VVLETDQRKPVEGDVLVGADGLWSQVRKQLWDDGAPRVTGHLAFRAMLPQSLPLALRSQSVTAWLGPRLHVVAYPVRGGRLAEHRGHRARRGRRRSQPMGPQHQCAAAAGGAGGHQQRLAGPGAGGARWRLWALCDRPPVASADQMARGRVALLGDAAHPMRPYLAQGAGMAIEDAQALAQSLAMHEIDLPTRLRRYALNRWQRCARVQARAERNGRIFHSSGLLRWGRDLGLGLLGERLLDVPWLYGGDPLNPLPLPQPQ